MIKNKAYFKRYQVKYRRRRDGKTDYAQRRRLVVNDKSKYGMHKYRLVVRFSNRYCTCQVVYSTISNDVVICHASSAEFPKKYGVPACGLKSYAAAYATGLLCARRLLQCSPHLAGMGLHEKYAPVEEITGEIETDEDPILPRRIAAKIEEYPKLEERFTKKRLCYVPELDDDSRPFRCYLDIGVRVATRGCKLFGALKGAVDGGLDIPHSEKRFPGYDVETGEYDAEEHVARIVGAQVKAAMEYVKEQKGEETYAKHFAKYVEAGIGPDGVEGHFRGLFDKIKADPKPIHAMPAGTPAERKEQRAQRKGAVAHDPSKKNPPKRTAVERREEINRLKDAYRTILQRQAAAADSDSDDDDEDESGSDDE